MARVNNVDIDRIADFAGEIKQDPAKAKRVQVIEGEWLLGEGEPQFRSTINFEGGQATFVTDNPTFMGGGGSLPGPMHYCFFGLASCYTGVFAAAASGLGIELRKLTIRVEASMDFSRVFGVADEPIMEEVRVTVRAESDAPEEKIKEAEALALERCPVVFTLRNQIRLVPVLEIVR